MKKTTKTVLSSVTIVVIALVAYYVVNTWRVVKYGIPEAYAAWDCATLAIEFMDTHDGAWPRSWDELFSSVQTMTNGSRVLRGHSGENIRQISELTRVVWDADRQGLLRVNDDDTGLRVPVITRPDGSAFKTVWAAAEPNAMIWDYLKTRSAPVGPR